MSRTPFRALVFVVVFAAALIGGSLIGRAQQTQPSPDVLSALVIEVRGLRAALEQMASAGPRGQLALGRLQLQEQRIANQVRRLDAVMETIATLRKELQPHEQFLKELTEALSDGSLDRETKREREYQIAATRARIAPRKAELQRLEIGQQVVVQDTAGEQGRWRDFNHRLEELDRALARR